MSASLSCGKRRRGRVQLGSLAGALVLAGVTVAGAAAGPASRPNLVFILADDLGWRDTSLYGSRFYETPNLERLAQRGMMFRNAYAANPLCSPTRASILTGLYPGRLGITAPVCHLPEERLEAALVKSAPPHVKALQQTSATRLSTNHWTLAEALKEAGYVTGHFGKWHLGPEPYSAREQGFDVDVPHYPGPGPAGSYLAPWKFPPKLDFTGPPGEHIEDRMAREAVRFLRANRDRPFYLNYWAFSVHSPFDAKPALVERYRRKADPNSPQRNGLYAAMVHSLDDAVGTLLDTLDDLKLAERTIVVFFSDNGGVHWAGHRGTGNEAELQQIPITSNAPLRGGKATLYEGGTREPCVVVWPGRVQPGSKSDAFLCSVDFYPTLLEMLGLKPAPAQRLDGVSQVPALLGQGAPRDTLFCFFPHYVKATDNLPGTWVRRGDWKLIRFHDDRDDQTDRFELYHLGQDIGETNNLAGQFPEKVRELNALIAQHLEETSALVPKPNPAYRKGASPEARTAAPPVAGWTPSRNARLAIQGDQLVVTSSGGDPYMATREVPAVPGPFTLEVRMHSDSRGDAQVFWRTQRPQPFHRDRSVIFTPRHDAAWHTYQVRLPVTEALSALRLDPSTGPGEIRLQWLRLCDGTGAVAKEWTWGEPAKR